MPRSSDPNIAIKNSLLRSNEDKIRIKRMKIDAAMKDQPDAVAPVYDMLAEMGLVPFNCMDDQDLSHGGKSSVLEMSNGAQKRNKLRRVNRSARSAT